jgi:hypothetical protein
MDKHAKAGYARQRQYHDWKKDHPPRREMRLVQAVEAMRLDIVDYEYEVEEDGWHGWYSVAFVMDGQLCLIDIPSGKGGKKNNSRRDKKIAYAERHGIPILIITKGTALEMRARIELWRLRMRREARHANHETGNEDAG